MIGPEEISGNKAKIKIKAPGGRDCGVGGGGGRKEQLKKK